MVAIAVSAGLETWQAYLGLAFLAGYMAHIGADLMTKEGCAMLYPLSRRRYTVWPSVQTGGKGESLVVLIIAAMLGGMIYFLHPDVFAPAAWRAALLSHLTFPGIVSPPA
ncbi:hypothetical protein AA105894_1668 [Asaia spathodeae NBRC 105894]|nr:hypothetical protein AA105894_1668 [Asaia spathodeae NBRC 105894]